MPKLCAAGIQLRNQIDDDYPDRDRKSDGWIADSRHIAKGTSDHIPDAKSGIVRAIDVSESTSIALTIYQTLNQESLEQ